MNSNLSEPIAVTLLVINVLEELSIPYVVVGSLASSKHGTARATMDSDLVIDLDFSQISPLVSKLQGDFYADEQMAIGALENKSSFNLIHFETAFKVDLFVAGNGEFDRAQLERRVARAVAEDFEREIYFLSAEDTILAKLRWYRMGGEQSERQWRDVEGILNVQMGALDFDYMRSMAGTMGVGDLLERLGSGRN